MSRKILVVLMMTAASFIITVFYGNAVIYHGIPQIPNVFLCCQLIQAERVFMI